jgi:hypothetical protein
MSSFSGVWIVFVVAGLGWLLRPLIAKMLQQRGVIHRPSDVYEIPQRTRVALRIERFEVWSSYIGGICMILSGLAMRFAPGITPIATSALLLSGLTFIVLYSLSVNWRR